MGAQFEGVGGSIIVSIIAFSIVFAVLFGLTVVIYAMKFFSKEGEASGGGSSTTPIKAAPAATAAPAAARPSDPQAKVVAAITAAILAATGGRGRILSVIPEGPAALDSSRWTRTWRTAGILTLNGNRLDRAWKR